MWGEVEKGSRLAAVRFESETEWCHIPFTGSGKIISDLNIRVSVGAYVNALASLTVSHAISIAEHFVNCHIVLQPVWVLSTISLPPHPRIPNLCLISGTCVYFKYKVMASEFTRCKKVD